MGHVLHVQCQQIGNSEDDWEKYVADGISAAETIEEMTAEEISDNIDGWKRSLQEFKAEIEIRNSRDDWGIGKSQSLNEKYVNLEIT